MIPVQVNDIIKLPKMSNSSSVKKINSIIEQDFDQQMSQNKKEILIFKQLLMIFTVHCTGIIKRFQQHWALFSLSLFLPFSLSPFLPFSLSLLLNVLNLPLSCLMSFFIGLFWGEFTKRTHFSSCFETASKVLLSYVLSLRKNSRKFFFVIFYVFSFSLFHLIDSLASIKYYFEDNVFFPGNFTKKLFFHRCQRFLRVSLSLSGKRMMKIWWKTRLTSN